MRVLLVCNAVTLEVLAALLVADDETLERMAEAVLLALD